MSTTTALLVIDVQVGLIEGENPVYQADAMLERIAGLIAAARAAGTPVIYVQDKDVGGVGTPEWQVHPAVAPKPTELAVRKAWSDSFYETTLGAELQARGITQLVIVGMKTDDQLPRGGAGLRRDAGIRRAYNYRQPRADGGADDRLP